MRKDIEKATKVSGTRNTQETVHEGRRGAGSLLASDWRKRLAARAQEQAAEPAPPELAAKAREAVEASIGAMLADHRNCGEPLWTLPRPSNAKPASWDPFCASSETRRETGLGLRDDFDPEEIDEMERATYEGERRDRNMDGLLAEDKRPEVEALRRRLVETALEEMPPHAARAFRLYARSRSVYGLAVSLAMPLAKALDVLDWAIHCIDGAFVRAGLEPVSEVTRAVML